MKPSYHSRILLLAESCEKNFGHNDTFHEGALDSSTQNSLESCPETLIGVIQRESSDAVSVHTASTSVSGNGEFQ